jgi:hypothetical protein
MRRVVICLSKFYSIPFSGTVMQVVELLVTNTMSEFVDHAISIVFQHLFDEILVYR